MSRNAKLVVVIVVVMFSIVSIVTMIVANIWYNAGYESGYSLAYTTRYSEGYSVGNLTGYQIGNSSGYNLGFSEGNMSGYESAYDIAYDEGYIQGSSEGNATGYEQGYDNGYAVGLEDGAGHGYVIRDPTYQEALQFINDDRTDANQYDEETYTCANFAADFKNNAFDEGYRCGYVEIEFPVYAHAAVCFNTIDKGLIFIEPQDDEIVSVRIGYTYWDRTIYEPPTYDDTVVRYMIVW